MNVLLGGAASSRSLTVSDLAAHFRATGLPGQSVHTYTKLAEFYNSLAGKGMTETDKGNAIKAYQKGLIINGDPHAVAFGVIAAAKTIRQGTAAVDVDRTPSWEEAYNMGIGKVTGSWDEIPWTRIALVGVGLLAAYGFATGLGKGIVSR